VIAVVVVPVTLATATPGSAPSLEGFHSATRVVRLSDSKLLLILRGLALSGREPWLAIFPGPVVKVFLCLERDPFCRVHPCAVGRTT
jgi:hypothetical protein